MPPGDPSRVAEGTANQGAKHRSHAEYQAEDAWRIVSGTHVLSGLAPGRLPWNMGRFRSGTMGIMRIMEPAKMPAPPRPATARPRMKTGEFGAAPHITDPTSKTRTLQR